MSVKIKIFVSLNIWKMSYRIWLLGEMKFCSHACTYHSSSESGWDYVLHRVRLPVSSVNHGVWIPARPCLSSQGHTQSSLTWCFSVTYVLCWEVFYLRSCLQKLEPQWHAPSQVGTLISTHFEISESTADGFTHAWQENCCDEMSF